MPDVIAITSTPLTQAQVQAVTQPIIDDAVQTEKEITSLIAAYKAHGAAGVEALIPSLYLTAKKDISDVKAVIPSIKEGWKTTEFWIVVGVELITVIYTLQGKETPVNGSEIMTALAGAYAVARGITKKGNS